jgi:hypothetical protein
MHRWPAWKSMTRSAPVALFTQPVNCPVALFGMEAFTTPPTVTATSAPTPNPRMVERCM